MTKTNDEVSDGRGYNLDTDKVEKTNKFGDLLRDVTTGTDTTEINDEAKGKLLLKQIVILKKNVLHYFSVLMNLEVV